MSIYPFMVERDDGVFVAQGVDLPGALTFHSDPDKLPAMALEALKIILDDLMERDLLIPAPSPAQAGQLLVEVPPETSLKLALYQIMHAVGLSREDLARQLGCDPSYASRLLDLFEDAPLGDLSKAIYWVATSLTRPTTLNPSS